MTLSGAQKRVVDRYGQTVTLRQFSKDSTDKYNDPTESTSETDISVLVASRGSPSIKAEIRGESGVDLEVDQVLLTTYDGSIDTVENRGEGQEDRIVRNSQVYSIKREREVEGVRTLELVKRT